jgi:riboflavin kinase/FMN adenylyltransferase
MIVHRSLAELPAPQPSVVTIGNFDGVHRGHRAVIATVMERARALQARPLLITFDPHPLAVLSPATEMRLITPLPHKLRLLAETGLPEVLVLPFTQELSQWPARQFAERILREAVGAVEVHEGETFRFGCGAEADIHALAAFGRELGFAVKALQPLLVRGAPVSSTRIRSLLTDGHVSAARALLGSSFSLDSTPARGRGYGTRYAVPTINLAAYDGLVPAHGVYITTLRVAGVHLFKGVTNVGNRPTFGEDSFAIESHLFNFTPVDLGEDTPLELTFLKRLREERRFASTEELRQQIGLDVQRATRYFALAQGCKLST